MKKILVTGSSGMLGGNIVLELKDVCDIFGIYKSRRNPNLKNQYRIDLSKDDDTLRGLISDIKPDAIIHCAAVTNVDACESDYQLAHLTNALSCEKLASLAGPDVKFIYISTDSVFDGKIGGYEETDRPLPINNYAKTKREGEVYTEKHSKNFIIIRTTIFGWNRVSGVSFAEWIFSSLKEKKPIKMFTDVIFSPINASALALLIHELLEKDFVGTLNVGSRNSCSKYDFGIKLARLFGFQESLITPTSVDNFEFKAKRPKNTTLDVTKAEALLGSLPTVEDGLNKFYTGRRCGETSHSNR